MVRLTPAAAKSPAFCLKFGKTLEPITYPQFQKMIRSLINKIGGNPSMYSTHSFRRGGATFAFQSQVPGELIKHVGDWHSDAYLRYLSFTLEDKLSVSHAMRDHILKS